MTEDKNSKISLTIDHWHAHLYYPADVSESEKLKPLTELISKEFGYSVGTRWAKPVGPHPVGSCQITVPTGELDRFIPWILKNRGSCDVFLHPNTGNDLEDHRDHAIWIGNSYPLNLTIFK